jgi:hypothetical protein
MRGEVVNQSSAPIGRGPASGQLSLAICGLVRKWDGCARPRRLRAAPGWAKNDAAASDSSLRSAAAGRAFRRRRGPREGFCHSLSTNQATNKSAHQRKKAPHSESKRRVKNVTAPGFRRCLVPRDLVGSRSSSNLSSCVCGGSFPSRSEEQQQQSGLGGCMMPLLCSLLACLLSCQAARGWSSGGGALHTHSRLPRSYDNINSGCSKEEWNQ